MSGILTGLCLYILLRAVNKVVPGIDPATEDSNKFRKKSSIHVSAHLVKNKPISIGTSESQKLKLKTLAPG